MRLLVFILTNAALVSSCLSAAAQEQPAPQAAPSVYTTVSGRVTCGDTGQPARFAAVQLIPEKPPEKSPAPDWANVKSEKDAAKLIAKSISFGQKSTGLSAVSAIDGSFEMPKVPAGTYYIVAQLKGYLSPLDTLTSEEKFGDVSKAISRIQAQAEKIVVQSAPVRADVRLERGGSISGVIRYDDGSPAAGVTPHRMVKKEDGKWVGDSYSGYPPEVTTDDRGHYRISGLVKGKYAVRAELPTTQMIQGLGGSNDNHMNLGDALVAYSGGVFREKEIKPIEISPGDEIDGVDIVFPIDSLHVVSGTVVAKTDAHPLNHAWVSLLDAETKDTLRRTQLEEDGSFKFNYVPEGPYALLTNHAGDMDKSNGDAVAQMFNPKFLKNYQDSTIPIEVKGDLTGLMVQVADQPAATAPAKPPTP